MMRATRTLTLAVAFVACCPWPTLAASPQDALAAVLAAYTRLEPVNKPLGLSASDAETVQRMVVLNLRPQWGEIAGYKAALTSPPAQARFGVSEPVSGVLLDNMFTSTGAIIDRARAVKPVIEADLLVRVADERINDATTGAGILAFLSEAIPFLELPDLMYADMQGLTGADISAINAGARLGATGEPVDLTVLEDAAERLGAFTVKLVDGDGNVLGRGIGEALLGHPLEAALWLKNDLARRGYRLEAGDLLSLGSLGPPLAIDGLTRITATYEGLAESPVTIHLGFK